MTHIEKLKTLLGVEDNSKDYLLSVIYELATASFLDYTNRNEVPPSAEPAVLELAVTRYNRIGTEGLDSTTYSGISEHYANEFSDGEKATLNRWRKIRFL